MGLRREGYKIIGQSIDISFYMVCAIKTITLVCCMRATFADDNVLIASDNNIHDASSKLQNNDLTRKMGNPS